MVGWLDGIWMGIELGLQGSGPELELDNSYFRRNKSNTIEKIQEKNIQVTNIVLFHRGFVQ